MLSTLRFPTATRGACHRSFFPPYSFFLLFVDPLIPLGRRSHSSHRKSVDDRQNPGSTAYTGHARFKRASLPQSQPQPYLFVIPFSHIFLSFLFPFFLFSSSLGCFAACRLKRLGFLSHITLKLTFPSVLICPRSEIVVEGAAASTYEPSLRQGKNKFIAFSDLSSLRPLGLRTTERPPGAPPRRHRAERNRSTGEPNECFAFQNY